MSSDTTKIRTPSRETVLKRELNALNRELATVRQKQEKLRSATATLAELAKEEEAIMNRLPILKSELIAELGLGDEV